MIEATIVEVLLSNQYQQGIDWNRIATGAGWGLGIAGAAITAASTIGGSTGGLTTLTYTSDLPHHLQSVCSTPSAPPKVLSARRFRCSTTRRPS